ncbi:acyltransferase [Microbacterium sp. X-17]|uniref:acyltransferase family protein n=1 Tax=Microbacterium sp. X-17 TaxID=3144404 RepID=UPI0031F4FA7C
MQRRFELDSLRGLAALSVLLYHALALNSAQLTSALSLGPVTSFWGQLLVYSPLHLLWLGGEAVWLFFVLSGFVLTRAAQRSGFSWNSYYPSRIVRLYLPVLAAVALAWLTYLYPHVLTPGMDQLLPTSYPPVNILQDVTLVGGTTTSLGVLWSLQWEVVFSLALPLYLILGRRWPAISGVIGLTLCLAGWWYNNPATSFLPMFLLGVILASHWERIQDLIGFLASGRVRAHVVGAIALALVCVGLLSYYLFGPFLGPYARVDTVPLALAAIALLICIAQVWPPLRSLLSVRPFTFLGRISYSLYLVHLPLVVLFLFVLSRGYVSAFVAIVVALVTAVIFYFLVERPAHLLSRRVSRRLGEERTAILESK